jgi:hypothetical protein
MGRRLRRLTGRARRRSLTATAGGNDVSYAFFHRPHLLRLSALSVMCAATVARAQIPVPAQPPAPVLVTPAPALVDSIPTFERPNGSLMRSGALTYALSLTKPSGQLVQLGVRSVVVSETSIGGTQGWLVAEARSGTVVPSTDSVYLARADLAPERWSATIGRSQLGASFSRDSVFGALETYQGRSSFAMALPPGALLSAGMVERVIELLPLRLGYRASASLVIVDGASPRVLPAEIIVDREERVNLGSRSEDCWVVAIRAGALEQRLWVSKRDSRVVRAEQAVTDGVLASVLQP